MNWATAIVNGSILGAALTAAIWLAFRLIPLRALNAATQYAIWCVTLVMVMALPALYLKTPLREKAAVVVPPTIVLEPVGQPVLATSRPSGRFFGASANAPLRVRNVEVPANSTRLKFPLAIPAGRWLNWLAYAWALTALFLLLRLGASCVLLERRKSRAIPAPLQLEARLEQWLVRCGTSRQVRLAGSTEISTPMAAGLRRPTILMPAQLFDELDSEELDQIGLHEAAHLARRDDLALLLQRVVEAVCPLHPLVRWICRRIDLEREIACDDFVLAVTGRPAPYAACLTRVIELSGGVRTSPLAAAAVEQRSHLARRVEMLLDKSRHTGTRLLKMRLAAVLAALVALVWFAAKAPGVVAFAAQTQAPAGTAQAPLKNLDSLLRQVDQQTQAVDRQLKTMEKEGFIQALDSVVREIEQQTKAVNSPLLAAQLPPGPPVVDQSSQASNEERRIQLIRKIEELRSEIDRRARNHDSVETQALQLDQATYQLSQLLPEDLRRALEAGSATARRLVEDRLRNEIQPMSDELQRQRASTETQLAQLRQAEHQLSQILSNASTTPNLDQALARLKQATEELRAAQQALLQTGLVAYEGFEYPQNSPAAGWDGGIGFASPWNQGGFGAAKGPSYKIDSGVTSPALGDFEGLTRTLLRPLGVDGTTVYLSVRIRPEGRLNEGDLNGFVELCLHSNQGVCIGKPGADRKEEYVIENRGGSAQVSSGVPVLSGQSALLVLKAEFLAGHDRFTLYVNPAPGRAEPANGTVKNDLDVGAVDGLTIYSSGAFTMSEIHIATTFADATLPVGPRR